MKGKIYQAGISSSTTLSLNNGFPTVEDIGPEENKSWEHVETTSRRSANVGFLAIEDVHLPQDPRTLIVYGNLVNRPPGWKWIEENVLCATVYSSCIEPNTDINRVNDREMLIEKLV